MDRSNRGIAVLAAAIAASGLWPGSARALTRDIAELDGTPLTLRRSVIGELSDGVLRDPFDEFLLRPYNLDLTNIERMAGVSPWPGQAGEQNRYVDFVIGNNGSSNVRNGADALQGTYIAQPAGRLAWGVSAALLSDDLQNSDSAAGTTFADGEKLAGADARFATAWRLSDRMVLGGGLGAYDRTDEVRDGGFTQGAGGFFSLQEVAETGFDVDFGLRLFTGESRSWEAKLLAGFGSTEMNDFSETLDDTGAVTSRIVVARYDVRRRQIELSGGYNRRHVDDQGGWQVRAGVRRIEHELDNSDLAFADDGVTVTPSLTLLAQDPVTQNEVFASAETLFLRGWTQIFGGARLSLSQTDGSTSADSLGTVVDETIDDSRTRLALIMGLRQPLWNERFRLVARARAEWIDESAETDFGIAGSGTDLTRTATGYAIGVETVLHNMVFDLAWLFGGDPPPGAGTQASRQTIDLDRLVISATFGW